MGVFPREPRVGWRWGCEGPTGKVGFVALSQETPEGRTCPSITREVPKGAHVCGLAARWGSKHHSFHYWLSKCLKLERPGFENRHPTRILVLPSSSRSVFLQLVSRRPVSQRCSAATGWGCERWLLQFPGSLSEEVVA